MNEGDLVLCTVKKVENTVVFVTLPGGKEGTIISSEIAPGRIKHMRHHVVPNKKIVCKILDISNGNFHLSLRRVNSKEKKEVMQDYKQEQTIKAALKQILKEDYKEIKEKIFTDYSSLKDFANAVKEDEKILSSYIKDDKSFESLKKVIDKKRRSQEIRYSIEVKCLESDGVLRIKKLFKNCPENMSINYASAGNFKLRLLVDDFKQGKKEMTSILEELEIKAKKLNCEFSALEEK